MQGLGQALVTAIVAAGCLYCLIALAAVRSFRARRRGHPEPPAGEPVSFSVFKPLAGEEPGLERNLTACFKFDYKDYEILFAAREADDPGLVLAGSVAEAHMGIASRVLAAGEPPCPNAKVHSLAAMTREASGDVLVISDSDIRASPGLLRDLAAEFADPQVGVVTCPYRAVAGPSPWSTLEAVGMNTEFWAGVIVAQFLVPMDFAVGPTMAVRRSCLESIGGWEAFEEHLAEDFQIGRAACQAGFEVRLASHVVEHRIGSEGLARNLAHRLRWRRSTRRSRPVGYWGEILANPLPWALLLPVALGGVWWSWWLLGVTAALRAAVAIAVGRAVLGDRRTWRQLWLVPFQDFLSLLAWAGGLFGNRIAWRDRTYRLLNDGRLQRLDS